MATNFSKGLSVYGVPILPTSTPNFSTAETYFVSSVTGSNSDLGSESGKTVDNPFATIDHAIDKCTTKGDIIYVMENHAETVNSTADLQPDIAGVQIIGLGRANTRPTITLASTFIYPKSNIRVSGAGTRFSNIIFRDNSTNAGTTNVGLGILANDVCIDNCRFDVASSNAVTDYTIHVGTSAVAGLDRVRIVSNEFFNLGTTTACASAIKMRSTGSTTIDLQIVGNYFNGAYTRAVIWGTSESSFNSLAINFNSINQCSTVTADPAIDVESTKVTESAGTIMGNWIATSASGGSTQSGIICGFFKLAENVFQNSTALRGNLNGIRTS